MTAKTMTAETAPTTDVAEERKAKSFTFHFPTIARVLLGLFLLVCGATGLLHLIPPAPAHLPEAAVAFNTGMMKTGYMFPLIFGTQAVVGALLVSNRFVPLALALLAPFIVNSVAFHAFLVPQGLGMALGVLALELYLVWAYRKTYFSMLAPCTTPATK